MSEGFLKRYTELPFLLYALSSKRLTLLDPSKWDDRNDALFMETYKERKELGSVLALCFSRSSETYHHWSVFSQGSSGVCINFHRGKFEEWANATNDLKFGKVSYHKLQDLKGMEFAVDEMPFAKRWAFRDEREARLVLETDEICLRAKDIKFSLDLISEIVLSPWLPISVVKKVKETIRSIDGCSDIKIFRTTLVDNPIWQSRAHTGL